MFSFEGTLTISTDGMEARFTGDRQDLTLDVDDPAPLFALLGGLQIANLRDRLTTAREAAALLNEYGLTLRIVQRGRTLLVLGRNAHPGVIGGLTQVPHLQIGVADAVRLLTSY